MGRGPPGSAGVPPACTPVRFRSVSLPCGTRPPCRRVRHGLGRSRVPAPLPVGPGGGDEPGCGKTCAGGTPALPGGLRSLTSSQHRISIGIRVYSWFLFNNHRQVLPHMIRPAGQGRHLRETNVGAGCQVTGLKPSMSKWFIYMDGQDEQDFWARVTSALRSTIAQDSTRIPIPSSKLMEHLKHNPDHGASRLPVPQPLLLTILSILCIHVQ